MPSISKTIGLILVILSPPALTAQTAWPNQDNPSTSHPPPSGYRPMFGQNSRFAADRMPAAVGLQRPEGPLAEQGITAAAHLHGTPQAAPIAYRADLFTADHRNRPSVERAYETPNRQAQSGQQSGQPNSGIPLSPRAHRSDLPLPPPGSSARTQGNPGGGLGSAVTVAGSLALVLGVFFLVAWGMRRAAPAGASALPGEVFEVLGRAPMASRQQVFLLRCGSKLILVSVTAAGAETLTEITHPAEVDRLAGLCRQTHPNSATAAFRQVFGQFTSFGPGAALLKAVDRAGSTPDTIDPRENRDASKHI